MTLRRSEAFFGLHFDLHPRFDDTSLGKDITEKMIARLLKKVRPDYVQYDCKGHVGYAGFPTRVGYPSPGIVKDSLKIWRKVTKRHGVGLHIHYCGIGDKTAAQHHPSWTIVNADGKKDNYVHRLSGPYADRLLIPQIEEAAKKYDLDGVWVDGDCWTFKPDYSPETIRAWKKETGCRNVPRTPDSPHYPEFMDFTRRNYMRYLRHYVDELHSRVPGFQIACNWFYSVYAPYKPEIAVDWLSGDYSCNDACSFARRDARFFASTGKPWDLMAWGFNGGKNVLRTHKPPVHLMQEAAMVISQGGGFEVYYTPMRTGWIPEHVITTASKVAKFCRQRQSVSHKAATVPQIALVLSETSYFNRAKLLFWPKNGEYDAMQGILELLLSGHYSVDILAEYQTEKLSEYPLLIIPEAHMLSGKFKTWLKQYMEKGGTVLLTGAETAALFKKELGVKFEGPARRTFALVGDKSMPGTLGGIWQKVKTKKARVIGWYYTIRKKHLQNNIAATVNRVGKGRLAAVYGPAGAVYFNSHYPAVRQFFLPIVSRLFNPAVKLEGQRDIDVVLRRKDNKLLVHLVNASGMQVVDRYAVIDTIPEAGPLTLTVRLPEKPESVKLVPSGKITTWTWKKGILTVKIRRLKIHEVVVIE